MGEKWPTNFAWEIRLPRNFQGSLTCSKSATWDRRLYFPSEGRRAEDFFRPKNPTASAGFEPAILGTREYSMSHYNISNFTLPSDSTEQLFSCHQTSSKLPTMHGSFSFIDTIRKACLFINHCSYLLTCLASIFMPSFNILICTACLWTETKINK